MDACYEYVRLQWTDAHRIAHRVRAQSSTVFRLRGVRLDAEGARREDSLRELPEGDRLRMESTRQTPREGPDEAPGVELEWLYDDEANPSELTIFSPEDRKLASEWITADRSVARSLDGVR